jgi:hypothetical protein
MKLVKLLTLLMIVFSFSGCKKESSNPAVAAVVEDFTEITINGNTQKKNTLITSGSQNMYNYEYRTFFQLNTAAYFVGLSLHYIKFEKDFIAANLKTGEYRLHNQEYSYDKDIIKNLDLDISMDDNNSSQYNPFILQAGSRHTVTSIVKKGDSESGKSMYAISGTFSCKLLDQKTNITYTINGKYQNTIKLLK